ncbi:MAG: sulfatase [Polyangiaceae bacterium]
MQLDRSLVLGLPLLAFGCSDPTPAAPAEPAQAPAAEQATAKPTAAVDKTAKHEAAAGKRRWAPGPLNVIMLTIDALRTDMPWNGYSRPIAPNLTKLASRAVVFDDHRSTTSVTAQSLPTVLSGRFTSSLYRSGYFFAGYPDANEFFPELLQAQGVRTMAVQAHMYFDRGKGLNQGFDVWQMVDGITYNEKTDEHVTSEKTAAAMQDLLSKAENTSGQFFAWTHFMDPHHEYVKHAESPDFGSGSRDVYDNEVHYTDHHLGEFLAFAEKQPWWKRTALIITADHGEAFGEHGRNQHAHELYEELVKVPLLVYAPGLDAAHVKGNHTHLDLAPTILELMGKATPSGMQGRSLVPALRGETMPEQAATLELAADNVQAPRRAIVDGRYKLIRFGTKAAQGEKLFDLAEDPGEKRDLSREQPEKAAELSRKLDQRFEAVPTVQPFGGMRLKDGSVANGPQKPSVASL